MLIEMDFVMTYVAGLWRTTEVDPRRRPVRFLLAGESLPADIDSALFCDRLFALVAKRAFGNQPIAVDC